MLNEIVKNLVKDFRIEFRIKSSISTAISFAVISTLAVSLATGGIPLEVKTLSIFLWIILFFSAMNGLSHIFVREEEQGTALFLRLNSHIEAVYLSKLIFNILFFVVIEFTVSLLFVFFLQVEVKNITLFIFTILSGGLALATATTILASMVAKADGRGALFTIISFPIILPVLWIAIALTDNSLTATRAEQFGSLYFLLAFSGFMGAMSYLLFKYIWLDE